MHLPRSWIYAIMNSFFSRHELAREAVEMRSLYTERQSSAGGGNVKKQNFSTFGTCGLSDTYLSIFGWGTP
jgi:hypothetical protein